MTNIKFKNKLESLLKLDSRLVDENKELNLAAIRDLSDKTDSKLIELLLSNDEATKKFFLKTKDVLVFKQNDFKFFLDSNQIDNSYTAFENRIGLASGSRLLKENNDVVLNFPYKDCVLEGGQSTEEGTDEYYFYNEEEEKYVIKTSQRKEIFFNEVIAKDEIDRLEEPKAFTNIVKYTAKGKEKIKSFEKNRNSLITDNLIIKGNNLLTLHCLRKQFTEQVKLIYIDPPFNTDNDTFRYNDRFNHSTWMVFMKNRLEIAKELLKPDGVIVIHIDQIEQAYLHILMDEIFERENFINTIAVKSSTPSGTKTVHKDKTLLKQKDFLLFYRKTNMVRFTPQYKRKEKWDTHFNFYLNRKKETVEALLDILIEKKILQKSSSLSDLNIDNPIHRKFYLENKNLICQTQSHKNNELKEKSRKLKDKVLFVNKDSDAEVMFYNGRQLTPLKNSINKVVFNGKEVEDLSMLVCDFWDDIDFQNTQNEGGVSFTNGKKPEELLYRILNLTTKKNDLVLDFFVGSGTTSCVSLKMERRFIGIEQMDYIQELPLDRIINTIKGELGGISKVVNWKGGGSFVYMELKKWNEEAKEKITECNSLKELEKLLKELSEKYFLNYNVKLKEFQEKIIHEDAFKKLPLKKQQEMFSKMLDLNQLYVNASEIEDKKYGLSKEDIALTKNFYTQQ